MKLLVKTSIYYFYASFILLIVFGGLLFLILKSDISDEIQEQLDLQIEMISSEISQGNTIHYPLTTVAKTEIKQPRRFRDTLIYDHFQKQIEGYYALTETRRIGKHDYAITVMTTYIGWEEYFKTIGLVFFLLGVLLLGSGVAVNFFISRKIWNPFITNLALVKKHVLSSKEKLILVNTNTDEFEDLNTVLMDFASRAQNEYQGLQEFTENSSHELQTPISIIRSRLENLGQMDLSEDGIRHLNDAREALSRLSKVNKGLLLLAKLSGTQFPDVQQVSVSTLLTNHISQLEELFISRNLQLHTSIADCVVNASPHLVDILLSNLLSNQLKYAGKDSVVMVTLDSEMIDFRNEGPPLPFPETDIFNRFTKGNPDKSGVGLGLSIVKKICDIHQWKIIYYYETGVHIFQVYFSPVTD
jgi:signal transduction histidine kinase